MGLSHADTAGRAKMVDVGAKPISARSATARGSVTMSADAFAQVAANSGAKGDVLSVAKVAGIMAAKRTSELIPLCHQLGLDGVDLDLELDRALPGVHIVATARVEARTGVEMEAMVAVSVACLTVYDMVKAVDRAMVIGPIYLVAKSGGRSGEYRRDRSAEGGNG